MSQPDPPVEILLIIAKSERGGQPEPLAAVVPLAAEELPRTGATGIREETLLALLMLLVGAFARTISRRRARPTAG